MLFIVGQLRAYESIDLIDLGDILFVAPLQSADLKAFDILAESKVFIFVQLQNCQILR